MAQSLSAANAKALDSLGVSKQEFDTALSAAETACADFVKRVKANIQGIPDFVNSGKIENLTVESEGDEVHIMGSEHLLYQYKGVNGTQIALYDTPYTYKDKRPPIDAFLLWIQSKNIRLVHNERHYGKPSPFKATTEDKQQIQLAWAMATSVYQKGFKPHPEIKWDEEKETLKQDLIKNAKGFVIGKLKTEIYNKYGDNVENKGK
jgi:hypothetical protein